MNAKNLRIALITMIVTVAPAIAKATDAWVSVVIVTERGVQATSQRDWLEMVTGAGADNVRLRAHQPGDKPSLDASGSDERPRYNLVGVLSGRGKLLLPGGSFDLRSRAELRDYIERLAADGAEGVTADRGAFGLTRKQTTLMHDDLVQPLDMETTGLALADLLKAVDKATQLDLRMDDAAWRLVRDAEPIEAEFNELTIGSAVAMMLKREGLVLVPTKQRGEAAVHRVARAGDVKGETWPIGWKPNHSRGELAPALNERINAEIEGYTLAEAMESIAPRMAIPVYWDHAVMAAKEIDPTEIQVKLPRQRTPLGRVVDRLLFQARLRGELRVDEAGKPFYWISR